MTTYQVKIKAFADEPNRPDVHYRNVAVEVTREEAERIVNAIADPNTHHTIVNDWLDEMQAADRTLKGMGPTAITRGQITNLLRSLGLRSNERKG